MLLLIKNWTFKSGQSFRELCYLKRSHDIQSPKRDCIFPEENSSAHPRNNESSLADKNPSLLALPQQHTQIHLY